MNKKIQELKDIFIFFTNKGYENGEDKTDKPKQMDRLHSLGIICCFCNWICLLLYDLEYVSGKIYCDHGNCFCDFSRIDHDHA